MLVALHNIVLGAPDVVAQVGVAVVVSVPGVVARHLDEVSRGVAVAGDVAQVEGVGEVFVVQRNLHRRFSISGYLESSLSLPERRHQVPSHSHTCCRSRAWSFHSW